MSGYLNEATLIGNLGQDPEVRTMQSGDRVVTLSVATSESWKDKQSGERKDRTEWHRVSIFNQGLCTIAEKFLAKGSKVFVRGALRTRKWQDQSGADRYSTEIQLTPYNGTLTFLDNKKNGDSSSRPETSQRAGTGAGGGESGGYDPNDEIPF